MNIGTNLYTLRKEKKITQAQLAEKLGVSEQAISKWENNLCAPDVSLFPVIAEYFGVSIDRIFGYHINSYANEVKVIISEADNSMDTYKEIEILSAALKKYPNSPELKTYLAFCYSMIHRISKDESERSEAVKKAVELCTEVVNGCGDNKKVDVALNVLTRLYSETENYQKAEETISKISADCFHFRTVEMVKLFGYKKCFAEQKQYAEDSLWKLYWTMSHVFENLTHSYMVNKEYEKAIAFLEANEKLLSVFDGGCADFYATYKIMACENKAKAYMKMGDKPKCLAELKRFLALAKQVEAVAKSRDFNIAVRNPMYFSNICEGIGEEYMSDVHPERAFTEYDAFFGEDEAYIRFKESITL